MVARNFQADYQRPVGNGPPRIVALLEYRFLELIGPLAYPPSVVARHFFLLFSSSLSPSFSHSSDVFCLRRCFREVFEGPLRGEVK